MAGLAWLARIEWVHRQRRYWREHDANLASAWREEFAEAPSCDVIVLDEADSPVLVLP